MTGFWVSLALGAAVFALAMLGLGLGALLGRAPLRGCGAAACAACRQPCPRRGAAGDAAPEPSEDARADA